MIGSFALDIVTEDVDVLLDGDMLMEIECHQIKIFALSSKEPELHLVLIFGDHQFRCTSISSPR